MSSFYVIAIIFKYKDDKYFFLIKSKFIETKKYA